MHSLQLSDVAILLHGKRPEPINTNCGFRIVECGLQILSLSQLFWNEQEIDKEEKRFGARNPNSAIGNQFIPLQ
jgi:hypothetical protein